MFRPAVIFVFALLSGLVAAGTPAADLDTGKLFGEMRWRDIGPFRGGRTRALCGIPSQPNVFYVAAVNGGVWKTNDYGHTWNPVFDHEDTGSVGAIAIAPSDPNIIYVGSGEGLQRPDLSTGDGIYKSIDGGQTWQHLGLRNGQQIPQIAVDARNPNRLFVAVLGHPYGPNEERGVYRSDDGGRTFTKVLYKDENTGANDVKLDPTDDNVVYASLWEARQGPWENAAFSGTQGGIYKSTDGGDHWQPVTTGLPETGVVQANLAISPANHNRIYASVATQTATGIYRSDDGGAAWVKITDDSRPAARIGGGDLSVPVADPKNPDLVYSTSVVTWKSEDGGKTWTGIRGAPGGDDYQGMWINPNNTAIKLLVSDQGAVVTVNDGETWTDWYNQPTAQLYHVAADNAFPYSVCSGQQESGSACVKTRGSDGEITFRDWHPVGVEEYGNAVPDPLDADLIYGGKVTRYNRRTGQVQNIGPKPVRDSKYRVVRTEPLVFSPVDPHTLYYASNTVWKTKNGGQSWQEISPDLTRGSWTAPESVGKYRDLPSARASQRGVIYALSPSPLDSNVLWAGTDDGLAHLTLDGGAHWKDVTPGVLVPWAKVSIIDASHFDKGTAYMAVNTLRLDDMRPHIYRTRDRGAHWTEIVQGIPDNAPVDVVREDPKRKGLLFAGSERAVYVSFDDGDNWHSLRLNMPATSIRDLMVKNDDLVAATHGRGFWILDDIEPLRQYSEATDAADAHLFKPQTALRVRWDTNTDTPLPPDVPAGKNPPDGAVFDYSLGNSANGEITLEVLDHSGRVVRKFSSSDPTPPPDAHLEIPHYWVRPPAHLSNAPGLHRFLWDLHYTELPRKNFEYPMQAVYEDTPPAPDSPWVLPGEYTLRLTADGKTYTQPFAVKMDPRVTTSITGLTQQFELSMQIYHDLQANAQVREEIRDFKQHLGERRKTDNSEKLANLSKSVDALEGEQTGRRGRGAPTGSDSFASVEGSLSGLLQTLQEADVAPTTQTVAAISNRRAALKKLTQQWSSLKGEL